MLVYQRVYDRMMFGMLDICFLSIVDYVSFLEMGLDSWIKMIFGDGWWR